jgi:uncharacterized membrane protein
MAKDAADVMGVALGKAAREAVQNVSKAARKRSRGHQLGPLSGPGGLAAGVGLAALAPLAGKGVSKLASGLSSNGSGPLKAVGEKLSDRVGEGVTSSVKDSVKDKVPGLGGASQGGKSQGVPGVGKGRRMPIQQDIDIGVPVGTVYNEWTQFERWPEFMHRVQQVSQEDESHLSFTTKAWGITKEFKAEILEQRPEERIKWRVTEGMIHNGVVTFHELAPRLTRVEINLDVEPGSLLEKAARGMRHVTRAVRADLARFKAHVLMEEEESGAWRGQVEDGDVKKKPSPRRSRSRSGSSESRARSSSRRTRGATNGGGQRSSNGAGKRSSTSSGSSARSAPGGRRTSGSRS